MEIFEDGTWWEQKATEVIFDCDFMFDFLFDNPGCGWSEAMGGADDYAIHDEEPFVPEERRTIERSQLQGEGWKPAMDRFTDNDRYVPPLLRACLRAKLCCLCDTRCCVPHPHTMECHLVHVKLQIAQNDVIRV